MNIETRDSIIQRMEEAIPVPEIERWARGRREVFDCINCHGRCGQHSALAKLLPSFRAEVFLS